MNILLISCAIEEDNLSYPLAPLYIKTAIDSRMKNSSCEIMTSSLSSDIRSLAKEIRRRNPDHIGFSIYMWNREFFDSLRCELKRTCPSARIFAGGCEISANLESFDLKDYEFLVCGEGEEATVSALMQIERGEVPEGEGIITEEHPAFSYSTVKDIDTILSPILSGEAARFMKPGSQILWEMTRGCPFACGFCFESKGLRSVRSFDLDRISKELDIIVRRKVADIFVLDPTFNLDRKRTLTILKMIEKKARDIHFTFELRAELIDEEMADAFSRINCSLQIGMQSIHKDVLETVNRKFCMSDFRKKVSLLEKRGIVFGIDIIIGLPNDSIEKFCQSLDFAASLKPSNIDIFPLSMLPGTVIRSRADEFSIKYLKSNPYTITETPTFSKQDIRRAMLIKNGCDMFYTKGQACMFIHLIRDSLDMTCSEIFEGFGEYIKDLDMEENDIYELQDEYVRKLFMKKGKKEYLEVVSSYMEMHQGISYLLETGEEPVVSLAFNPNVLSELDWMHIDRFMNEHRKAKRKDYVLYFDENGSLLFDQEI